MAVWVWVDDRVTEEEDLGGGGKGLLLQLGFWFVFSHLPSLTLELAFF